MAKGTGTSKVDDRPASSRGAGKAGAAGGTAGKTRPGGRAAPKKGSAGEQEQGEERSPYDRSRDARTPANRSGARKQTFVSGGEGRGGGAQPPPVRPPGARRRGGRR